MGGGYPAPSSTVYGGSGSGVNPRASATTRSVSACIRAPNCAAVAAVARDALASIRTGVPYEIVTPVTHTMFWLMFDWIQEPAPWLLYSAALLRSLKTLVLLQIIFTEFYGKLEMTTSRATIGSNLASTHP